MILFMFGASTPVLTDTRLYAKIVDIEHQRIVMDQIGFAGYGFTEKHQLLPDKFPCGSSVMANRTISRVLCEIDREDIEPFPQHGVDREEVHCIDELYLRFQKPLPGQ